MKVITARNVHEALPKAVQLLNQHGVERQSRNGPVRLAPWPVVTEYREPAERLAFWPQRDINVAFLVYEALWMLAGRNDLAPLTRYITDFGRYSDDDETLHGAYGYRWRRHFGHDQLCVIAERLRAYPEDRRCVLQMWSAQDDLGGIGKDYPCNTMATLQRDVTGALDMTVFCRSNDIIWGAYFANAFHFSVLQEYLALAIGCQVGVYRQISVNWHAYVEQLREVETLPATAFNGLYATPAKIEDPYASGLVRAVPLATQQGGETPTDVMRLVDRWLETLMLDADSGFTRSLQLEPVGWFGAARSVLQAHHLWHTLAAPERYMRALAVLAAADQSVDLVASMTTWVTRRALAFERRLVRAQDDGVAYA